MSLKIETMILGRVMTNVYLVSDPETGSCVIIDPAAHPKAIREKCTELGITPAAILLTHGHYDHIMAVNDLVKEYGIPVYASEDDRKILATPEVEFSGPYSQGKAVTEFTPLTEEIELDLIGRKWKVLQTPGHTKGSLCFYIESEGLLFSGDTLFEGTYGRYDLRTGSYEDIRRSLTEKLFLLPDEVTVYPGHEDPTSLRLEKKYNEILMDW